MVVRSDGLPHRRDHGVHGQHFSQERGQVLQRRWVQDRRRRSVVLRITRFQSEVGPLQHQRGCAHVGGSLNLSALRSRAGPGSFNRRLRSGVHARKNLDYATIDEGQWVAISRKRSKELEIGIVRVVTLNEINVGQYKFDRGTGKQLHDARRIERFATEEEIERAKGQANDLPL